MTKRILIFVILLSLTSCMKFENVEFKGVDKYKFKKIEDKELVLSLDFRINNPNNFNVKLKPSFVDIYVEDKLLGVAYLDNSLKLIKRAENIYSTDVNVKLEKGAMFQLLKYKLKRDVNVRFEGVLKGSVLGISKKVVLKETKVVSGDKFKFDFF